MGSIVQMGGSGMNQSKPTLVSLEDLTRPKNPSYRIKGLVNLENLITIAGPPGGGKTFLALSLIGAITSDSSEWFGRRVKPGYAIYACLEGLTGLMNRADALKASGVSIKSSRLAVWPHPLDLADPSDLIGSILDQIRDTSVVVIDTLHAATSGLNENDGRDMGMVIDGAKRIISETGSAVILVHHTAKDETKGMRGHSSLLGACDVVLTVKQEGASHSFTVTKNKDGKSGYRHYFDLRVVDLGIDEDGDPITSCVVEQSKAPSPMPKKPKGRPNQAKEHILDTMKRLASKSPDGGVHIKILRAECAEGKGPNYRNTWNDNYPLLLTAYVLREDGGIVYLVNENA